jgi:hypothetical protein
VSDDSVVEEPRSGGGAPVDKGVADGGVSKPHDVLMWEVRAADGRLDDLIAFARLHADRTAEIYVATDPDRLVLIDPSRRGLPEVPYGLVARPPHQWVFSKLRG